MTLSLLPESHLRQSAGQSLQGHKQSYRVGHSWGPRDPLPGAQGKGRSHSAEVGGSHPACVSGVLLSAINSQHPTQNRCCQHRCRLDGAAPVWVLSLHKPVPSFIAPWGGRELTQHLDFHTGPFITARLLGSERNRRFEPKESDSRGQSYLLYSSSQLGAVSPPGTFPSLACL